jgi:hypothetical protein
MDKQSEYISENVVDQRIKKIANQIKELCIKKGYSSHENFAWDHNLNRVQYWRIEKGSNITLKTLISILDIHQISLSDFLKILIKVLTPQFFRVFNWDAFIFRV